ncbi:MAG: hypothetical protein ACJ0HN_08785, partial [Alphaproteobacteria bacterium]
RGLKQSISEERPKVADVALLQTATVRRTVYTFMTRGVYGRSIGELLPHQAAGHCLGSRSSSAD